jgi:hypothetical protein
VAASRADDSQHTLVTVPVISTVSMSRSASRSGSGENPGKKALVAVFPTIKSASSTSNSCQSRDRNHCGSVWTHDTAIVAAGLARGGYGPRPSP